MRLRKYNKSLGWLSLFAGTVLLSGCNSALLDPKGQIGLEQRFTDTDGIWPDVDCRYSRNLDGCWFRLEVPCEQ